MDQSRRIAVLIDADNASPAHAPAVFDEIARHGEANVRRIYGDFSADKLKGWQKHMQPLAITPVQQFNYTTGKNAADITLVIDAMDIMHTGAVDMFCLVSSDSDFTRLAQRLREAGKTVLGFGERKTPEAFRKACNRFLYFDNLGMDTAADTLEKPADKDPPSKAVPLILKACAEHEDDEGWVTLGPLGQRLLSIAPDFDPRNYGQPKLSDLIQKTGAFNISKNANGGLRIKRKTKAKQSSTKTS